MLPRAVCAVCLCGCVCHTAIRFRIILDDIFFQYFKLQVVLLHFPFTIMNIPPEISMTTHGGSFLSYVRSRPTVGNLRGLSTKPWEIYNNSDDVAVAPFYLQCDSILATYSIQHISKLWGSCHNGLRKTPTKIMDEKCDSARLQIKPQLNIERVFSTILFHSIMTVVVYSRIYRF